MIRRISGLAFATLLLLCGLYLSRFWPFEWWGREGLFGIEALRPQGDLLRRWLRGTPFAAYDLLLWTVGAFFALSLIQTVADKLKK